MKILISILSLSFLILVAAARPARKYYYWSVQYAGKTIDVGPYPNAAYCADMYGSAIYSHPFACHTNPSAANCKNTGNGFAYPHSYKFPVTEPGQQIAGFEAGNCHVRYDVLYKAGWYFLYYDADGPHVGMSKDYKKTAAMPDKKVGYYANAKCPGAPSFSIWRDTACN